MHPTLQEFFDKHESTTATHRRAMNDALEPIADIHSASLKHFLDLELSIEKAERAISDPAMSGKLEWIHTRIRGARSEIEALKAQARAAVKRLAELEAIFTKDKPNIEFLSGDVAGDSPASSASNGAPTAPDPALQKPNKLTQRAIDAKDTSA
jgi:hypothetical protein